MHGPMGLLGEFLCTGVQIPLVDSKGLVKDMSFAFFFYFFLSFVSLGCERWETFSK